MKKVFTLALVMAMAITTFAQVKGVKKQSIKNLQPVQKVSVTGLEDLYANVPASTRSIITAPEEEELSYSTYDWQTNAASRNFVATWPDGFAVMCFTQATDATYSDRGTGLLIWDPAVGEWEFTETHVEDFSSLPAAERKTGFGSISRWGQNGLVIAAHSSNYCHLFFCEDFRNGSRDFSTVVTLPNELEPTWPCIQVSGENLDIVHVIATQYTSTDPFDDALRYYRYENGEFTVNAELLEVFDADHMGGGGSNITYFMPYNPEKPNRVSIVVNDAWVDGKVVISEDNGATWTEKVYYQHPGIHTTFESSFLYPRWASAAYDANDKLHIVYEWNGSTGEPGSGSYYPTIGGVAYWSENLYKDAMCIGGIGNVGEHFILDSTYLNQDLYMSEWYWSDANHDPLPEYFGELQILDEDLNVVPYDGELPETYYWLNLETKDHGAYNSGIAAFPSMFIDEQGRMFAFWSMIAGDGESMFWDGTNNFYRLFGSVSVDGGYTWTRPVHLLTDIMNLYDEMVYGQVIPYLYTDAEGDYVWYCYANDQETGTFVQGDESDATNNQYRAVKVYFHYLWDGVEEPTLTVAPSINVYPNPAQGSFNVRLNNESNVNIYNAVGQLVKTYNNVTELNVNLEAGVYFVNAGNQTVKVVVK
ncbi:MAG: T9SS type A sorting domain-containing protein [Bacteroidales bacterium]|nr:T9SS type A sorting domain-containing protein [Bacteroidales bacterium]